MRARGDVVRGSLAVLLLAGVLVACGDDDDDGTAAGEASGELSGELTIMGSTSRTGEGSFLALAAEGFEQENPDVEVTVEGAELDHMAQTLPAQVNAGRGPDIISTSTGFGTPISALDLAANNQLVDLSDEEWVDRMTDSFRSQASLDGRIYSLPTDQLAVGLHHDPAVFDGEGIAVPTTYAELLDLCETAAGNGTIAVSVSVGEPYLQQAFLALGIAAAEVDGDDPDLTEKLLAGDATFEESDGWRRAFEKLQEMTEAGCFGENPLGVTREAAEETFATGEAYMLASYSLGQARVEPLNPEADFGLLAVPADDAADTRVPLGPTVGLVIPQSGDNVEVARAFLAYVADNSEQFAADSGDAVVPVVVDDLENPPPLPDYLSELEPLILDGQTTIIYTDAWPDPEVATAFNEGVASLIQGSMEPDEVLGSMDAAWAAGD